LPFLVHINQKAALFRDLCPETRAAVCPRYHLDLITLRVHDNTPAGVTSGENAASYSAAKAFQRGGYRKVSNKVRLVRLSPTGYSL